MQVAKNGVRQPKSFHSPQSAFVKRIYTKTGGVVKQKKAWQWFDLMMVNL